MKLTGSQYEKLVNALLFSFPTVEYLERMVQYRLNSNLHEIGYGNLNNYVYKLIQWAEAHGNLDNLINGARQSNPENPELFDVAQELGITVSDVPSKRELQRLIRETNSFLNINDWRMKLSSIEFQVCRIEIKLNDHKFVNGTGFLIGPDSVITNYHVMKSVIENEQLKKKGRRWAEINNVVLRFDYKVNSQNLIVDTGTEFHLPPANWLIDSSPSSPLDVDPKPKNVPSMDQLDYAILRVDGSPGDDFIGKSAPGSFKRSWVKLPLEPYDFLPDSALIIVQHPSAEPLKLAFDTQSIIGLNENGTRVKYRTNTEPGSSGSPCFNINWELVALHHLGDPDYSMEHSPTYNQGIPFNSICELLKKRNLLDDLQN